MRLPLASVIWLVSVVALRAAEPPSWLTGVTARATSSQVEGLFGPQNVCNDHGLTETKPGSGIYQLTTNGYADGGSTWHSGYIALGGDENPILELDLGRVVTVGGFHVWNHNGSPHRGFRDVELTYSTDRKTWTTHAERLRFAKAPRSDDYTGEAHELNEGRGITARYLRFHCLHTHREGGNRELAGIGKLRFYEARPHTTKPPTPRFQAADGAGHVYVTAAPYRAVGDGQADDTAAIQKAIDDWQGTTRTILLPNGTYRITKPLRYTPAKGHGYNNLRGESRERTILRLADGTFTDAATPQPVLSLAFNGQPDGKGVHADWFNNNVHDLTIDTGRDNPGAIGLQYYANNVGSLRRVTIRSGDGQGTIGLDLGYADQNGPLLVQHVSVDGFDIGVRTGATVNSQTLEHIQIANARKVGFENHGQCLALRGLRVRGAGPGFVNHFGVVSLIDSHFESTDATAEHPAISSRETLFARNIETRGYRVAIENRRDNGTPHVAGPNVDEFVSSEPMALLSKSTKSLQLPIEETPEPQVDPVSTWANVRHFRELTDPDDSAALQRAIDSGATTISFPSQGTFFLGEPVILRGKVRRLVGHFARIQHVSADRPVLKASEGESPTIWIEDLIGHVRIHHAGSQTLVIRNAHGLDGEVTGTSKLFLDNVVAEWTFGRGQTWARQFNTEREGTHAVNTGGDLWILGLKTERGGTLVETNAGGRTEILGGLSYTTNQGGLAPMFTVTDGACSITLGEVCYSGDPFRELAAVTRGTETARLPRGDALLRPSFLGGSVLPLFVSRPE